MVRGIISETSSLLAGKNASHWQLDKRVNAALIASILAQLGAFIWYSGALSARVTNIEEQVRMLPAINEKVIRLDARLDSVSDNLVDLKVLLRGRNSTPSKAQSK